MQPHPPRFAILAVIAILLCLFQGVAWAGEDALAEVNAARAARGLRPFTQDDGLTQAAKAAADYRAQHRIEGHTRNDFQFVPAGTTARAAGCAAWPQGQGWGSCCTYEKWTYAGAAFSIGPDKKRYMHLFVR